MRIGAAIPVSDDMAAGRMYADVLRAVGGDVVELQAGRQLMANAEAINRGDFDFLRRPVEQIGLAVNSLHAPFGPKLDMSSPDESVRQAAVESGRVTAAAAAAVGAPFVVYHPGHLLKAAGDRDTHRRQAVRSLRELSDALGEVGVRAAVENMVPSVLAADVRELIDIVDEVGRDNVGFCLDTGHAHFNHVLGAEEVRCPRIRGPYPRPLPTVAEAVGLLGERLWTLHIHDNAGDRDNHFFPGKGTIDWGAFREALASAGYRGVFMHEVAVGEADFLLEPAQREQFLADYRSFLTPVAAL